MKTTIPLVSVIIPAHNAEDFLAEAIESVLHQTYRNLELIVVDDGSGDSTPKIVQKYANKDKRVKLISYRKNKGESAAANVGFKASKGQYIARMDADDVSLPTRLAKQVTFLEQHPDHMVVGSQATIINEHGKKVGQKLFPLKHDEIYAEFAEVHPMLHPAVMIRRSMIPWQGKLWANGGEPNDDYFTFFHFIHVGKFANLPQKLIKYRMHSDNKSMRNIKQKFWNITGIRWYAVTKLGYPLSWKLIKAVVSQAIVVTLLPEPVLVNLWLYTRGMKTLPELFPWLRPRPKVSEFRLAGLK